MATFPGTSGGNPLGIKVELNLAGTWTDITIYVMLRDFITMSNMGRADETGSITPSSLTLTLKNDGRFTPKNSSGAYFPNIVRNCQIRVSVNATSSTGVAYSGFRFFGEVAAWPPGYDTSQRDLYVQITASGIWRRIAQAQVPIGSCYWRYVNLLTGTSVPAAYWSMEDGSNTSGFVLSVGTGTNLAATGTPGYTGDGTSFPGSSALPSMNGARIAANVSSAATPTNNVFRFALSVPAQNDSSMTAFTSIEIAKMISASGGIKMITVSLSNAGQLTVNGYTTTAGGAAAFTGTITTKVTGVPVLVSIELTATTWALRIIKPNAGAVLDQVTGARSQAVAAVTQVQINEQGRLQDTIIGQAGVWYTIPALTTAASMIGGLIGELAATRFSRLCTESNIPGTLIGSGGAAMGPQVSDTMASVLQSIEDTDGGLLYETRDQFGLGYRTLASIQNQGAAAVINYSAGHLGAPLAPTYDDALLKNQWSVTNYDGYVATAQLNSGAISIQPPPNGVGQGYSQSKSINAQNDSQANAIAQQLLMLGTVDDVRFPVVTVNFQRTAAGSLFATVPGLRVGDYFQITNMPAFLGGGTSKQIAWGYTERMGGEPAPSWTFEFNAVPELPFETTFNPGSFTVAQGSGGTVPGGSSVGSTVSGSQITPGSISGPQVAQTLSARTVGGIAQFIAAATPYNWTFAVTGTPADNSYFSCTPVQALPIAVGDTFSNTAGLGSPFTVTSIEQVSATVTNVHFTPDATGVMSTGTVQGGKNGDTWVNTSAGNQVNQWQNGSWSALTWNAANVIAASSITAAQIAAGTITAAQIAAGIVIAGVVNGTTITGATIIADGTSGEILVYSGTPASGNLIGSWSGASGSDGLGNSYPAGLAVELGGLVLFNQTSAPAAVTGASSFYSSTAGRPRYLNSVGNDSVLERSTVNVASFTVGNNTAFTAIGAALSYLAGEGAQSSEFEIEIDGVATTANTGLTAQTLSFGLAVDGTILGGQFTVGAVFLPVGNKTFSYTIRFRLSVQTTGGVGTGQCNVTADGQMAAQGVNAGSTTSPVPTIAVGAQSGPNKGFDTTSAHTIDARAAWGANSTGQTLTTYRTKVARRM
jgi:hypothetical protein